MNKILRFLTTLCNLMIKFLLIFKSTKINFTRFFNVGYDTFWMDGEYYILYCGFITLSWIY